MPWTVTVGKVERNGYLMAVLTYTDKSRTLTEQYDIQGSLDSDYLAGRAKLKIAALEAQDALAATLPEGTLTPKDQIIVVEPAQQFADDCRDLNTMTKLVELGVLDAADATYEALRQTLRQTFDPAYLPWLRGPLL